MSWRLVAATTMMRAMTAAAMLMAAAVMMMTMVVLRGHMTLTRTWQRESKGHKQSSRWASGSAAGGCGR